MSRGRQTFGPSEFRKDIWGHLGPKFTLASFAESLITSEIYGQSRRKKEMLHRADLQPHPVFFFLFFSNNIRDDIPWQNLGMTAGRLGNSVEVLYFGVWSILYLQRSGRKEPGKRAGEMVRE